MEFLLIPPAGLRQWWPKISESLDAVLAKAPEDWIKEDVYHAIKAGSAACHVALNESGYAGLLVTTLTTAEFSGRKSLHVWIAHNAGDADVIEAGVDLLRNTARSAQIERVTFGSPRKGWAKRYPLLTATYEVPA